jgi:hypothetical protein
MVPTEGTVSPAVQVEGFVVQSWDGRFLSRKMRFVRHRNKKSTTGLQRAWVHTPDDLRSKTGDWTGAVEKVFPASYDSTGNQTVIKGGEIPYEDAFL